MRELTVRIRFTTPSLGSVKNRSQNKAHRGRFMLLRDAANRIIFMPSWHRASMRIAASILGRHQAAVKAIRWDPIIDVALPHNSWFRRYYTTGEKGRQRFSWHEALLAGQIIGINCMVPSTISDDDMFSLMSILGRYEGISHYRPGEYGYFDVVSIRRRAASDQ